MMPTWARYTGAIYFGLMMSGALAPPGRGVAATSPPTKHAALDHAKGSAEKQAHATPHKPPSAATPAGEEAAPAPATAQADPPAPQSQRFAPRPGPRLPDPPLPDGPDLLR